MDVNGLVLSHCSRHVSLTQAGMTRHTVPAVETLVWIVWRSRRRGLDPPVRDCAEETCLCLSGSAWGMKACEACTHIAVVLMARFRWTG